MKKSFIFLIQLIVSMLSFGLVFYWLAFEDYLMMTICLLTSILSGLKVVDVAKEISKKS